MARVPKALKSVGVGIAGMVDGHLDLVHQPSEARKPGAWRVASGTLVSHLIAGSLGGTTGMWMLKKMRAGEILVNSKSISTSRCCNDQKTQILCHVV